MKGPDPLGRPLSLGRTGAHVLRNRFVMTPHLGRLGGARLPAYVARRAPGYGMAILPAGIAMLGFPVYPPGVAHGLDVGRGDPDGVPLHPADDRYPAYHTRLGDLLRGLAQAVTAHGALAIGQIHHPGAEQSWDSFAPAIAPSAVRGDEFATVPHALSAREIRHLIDAYVATSASIVAAGFDGVELHASHGYLLNRFLSPHYNRRTDEWGAGPALVDRLLDEIRARIGDGPVLGIRLQVSEEIAGGLTSDSSAAIAVALADRLDYLSVSIGNHTGVRDNRPTTAYTSPWTTSPAPALGGARVIRRALAEAGHALPLLVTGRITTAELARSIVADGDADMIGLARALIADPDFPAKAIGGREGEIDRCIGCNECVRVPLSCPVNPEAGREGALALGIPSVRRRIVVVGAGPAGVNVATRAAQRGHLVTLIDREDGIGGALRRLVRSPLLAEWSAMVDQLERQLQRSGVTVLLSTEATDEVLAELDPDRVVWATGSEPVPLGFTVERGSSGDGESATGAPPLTTDALLGGKRPAPGVPVVVVAGAEPHLEPFIAADLLASEGWRVTVISERAALGGDVEPRTLNALWGRLAERGVRFELMLRPVVWSEGVLETENTFGGPPRSFAAGAVVVAQGRQAVPVPATDATAEPYLVGDALAPRRLTHAVLEGARFGAHV